MLTNIASKQFTEASVFYEHASTPKLTRNIEAGKTGEQKFGGFPSHVICKRSVFCEHTGLNKVVNPSHMLNMFEVICHLDYRRSDYIKWVWDNMGWCGLGWEKCGVV